MKRIVILTFAALLFCLNNYGNADSPIEPTVIEQKEPQAGNTPPFATEPAGPDQKASEADEGPPSSPEPDGMSEIFFAAGTVSADDKYLFVIFDRFLLQYALPTLDLKRKLDLNIAAAPVNPSISISKDSKYLYIISNGILYQIDLSIFKIKKRMKITP